MSHPSKKTAVVLFQLGGPDSLEAVEPFLYNLFMDPDIIDFPLSFLFRQSLAKLISSKRSLKVQENYKLIGGKSPILELTQQQANGLESQLRSNGIDVSVFIAMRYWNPLTAFVVQQIKAEGFEQVILLPLYPQFSKATTYSSINEWNLEVRKQELNIPTQIVCCYPNHPSLIEAIVDRINQTLIRFQNISPENIDLVFSAHGVPVKYIKMGDPYQMQIEETVRAVIEKGKWKSRHILCYQSKVGPMRWLEPSLLNTIEQLSSSSRRHLMIVPIAFVTDHIETLHEINIEVRAHAMKCGIRQFELMPALNAHQKFIECLTDLVKAYLNEPPNPQTCSLLWKQSPIRPKPKLCKALSFQN